MQLRLAAAQLGNVQPEGMGSSVKRLAVTCLLALLGTVALTSCGGDESGPPTLSFYTFTAGANGAFEKAVNRCNTAANGRYKIKIQELPPNADDQREQLARRLAAQDEGIDIMALDVIFTPEFGKAGWVKEWTGERQAQAESGTIPSTLETARFEGKLYGAPFTSNTQLLWYRKDRVDEPPKTWNEMIDTAERLGGAKNKIQVQGSQAEGLTVWFVALLRSAGGEVLAGEEKVALGEPAVRAASVMKRVATSSAADPALANNAEDEGRLAFEQGDSTFMVNYPFVYPSAKENAPKIFKVMGAARYPDVEGGPDSKPPLGGLNLAVGGYTKHEDLAFDAAICLRKPENQLTATELGGLPPTQESLYNNETVKKAYPGFEDLMLESIKAAAPRPPSPVYSDISLAIQKTLHPPRKIDPKSDIDELQDKIDQALNSGGLL